MPLVRRRPHSRLKWLIEHGYVTSRPPHDLTAAGEEFAERQRDQTDEHDDVYVSDFGVEDEFYGEL